MKLPVPKKLPSGSWRCQVRVNGTSRSVTEPTYDLCLARAMAIKSGLIHEKKNPEPITLGAACDAYISMRRGICSPTTLDGYQKIREQHFKGIMNKQISKIDEHMLSMAVSEECRRPAKRGSTLAPKTVRSALSFVISVLRDNGIQIGKVVAPEVKRRIVRIPDPEDVIRSVIGSPVELPCLLAAWLSLSMSEIRGLTKSRSLLDGKLYVLDSVVRARVNPQPENKASESKKKAPYADIKKEGGKEEQRTRVLSLPPYILDLINKVPGDIIVPLTVKQIEKGFQDCLSAAGLPHMTFHQLRHLNASTMAMLGIQKEVAQERGGWKTSHTMEAVYTHTFTSQRQAADKMIDTYFTGIIKNAHENAHGSQKRRVYRLVKLQ